MSIDDLIDYLDEYEKNLDNKIKEFLSRLIDRGITVAQGNTGEYGSYIHFSKKIEGTEDIQGLLIATDTKIISQWQTAHGVEGYEISPLLLAEFGSGFLAKVKYEIDGVGQGTMPNAKGHAKDLKGWYWVDMEGKKHHSTGTSPTYPMYSAMVGMMLDIDQIANEVFNG